MKKKKVFFILSSLKAGGSERVFYLLSKNFNTELYDVSLVLLNTNNPFFEIPISGVKIIDLKTVKTSKSIFKLIRLLRFEKSDCIFSTGTHINILVAFVSLFVSVPKLIARESNIPSQMKSYAGIKTKIVVKLISRLYWRFDVIICQSVEMLNTLNDVYKISREKFVVIPNPVLPAVSASAKQKTGTTNKLVIVARLSSEKGHLRLLKILRQLPNEYHLTIAGDGPFKNVINDKINAYNLNQRVTMCGQVKNAVELISRHDLLVLSSYTEGFPNVIIEALSTGIPVVAFKVGGITQIINEHNGYIVDQDDEAGFKQRIVDACNRKWDNQKIAIETQEQFGINKITDSYAALI